jgi:molybdate transport system substrate-binding protein
MNLEGKSVLNNRIRTLAAGMTAALMMMCASAYAQSSSIRVAVSPSFAKAAGDIAAAFTSYFLLNHGVTYNVSVLVSSDSLIESTIIAGGATGPYDIFLAGSPEAPLDLYVNYTSLVGTPFDYAIDTLEIYSPSVDVTGGLPFPLTTNFIMPNPSTDPYGQEVALLLAFGPWHIPPDQIPGGQVFTTATAGTSLALINLGRYAYGFVGKSQICTLSGGVENYPPGSYHHAYAVPVFVPTLLNLTAVPINRTTRTAAASTELSDFIAFLQGGTSSFGDAPTGGTTVIQNYCFALPPY